MRDSRSFPPPEQKGQMTDAWIFDALADQWSRWLPPSAIRTVRRWLLINATDPAQQLEWLVAELHESEAKGEKVHIIGHMPPGTHFALSVWSENYHRILERYESTVRGQFFGHTHRDEIEVAYDSTDDSRAIGVAYLSPSLTTYITGIPSFRVFTVDGGHPGASWSVLDHHTYLLNLTVANAQPDARPRWELEYSARAAYNLERLEPQQWHVALTKMEHDDELFYKFYRFYTKGLLSRCKGSCRRRLLCQQRTAISTNLEHCGVPAAAASGAPRSGSQVPWAFAVVTVATLRRQ
ncbi:sphingomyelin phosphodiesterase-like [Rhipicephalus sanguineus]|uniref:sphingomyelin phosphodiesterase-like n=1 Tax=Rhipicephalus sanguineus TaxID=34632 RepID=UPI0020C5832D|nr:sphingomyelin phosphodiesterase-like [Rhipicephalus sanguineus]